MTDKAVIQGTFADLKTVKTRSVVQMVIEIPIEHGAMIIDAFGFPRPGEEVPVAVARLDPNVAKAAPAPPEKPKTRFHDKPLSAQAGIRCGDEEFWRFLRSRNVACESDPVTQAAVYVRNYCAVKSRSEIANGCAAGDRWALLNMEYEQWAGLAPEAR